MENGLDVTAAHVGADLLKKDLDYMVDAYETVGVSKAVVPYLSPEDFETAAAVDRTGERLTELATDLAAYDWRLHYHNHEHEFTSIDDESAFDRLLTATDVVIEPISDGSPPLATIQLCS